MIEVVKITTTSAVHKFECSFELYHFITKRVGVQIVGITATIIRNMYKTTIVTVFRHLVKVKTESEFINS